MKIIDIKAGDLLKADGYFTCLISGSVYVVKKNTHDNLFIDCDEGEHSLDGQVDAEGEVIGLVKVSSQP